MIEYYNRKDKKYEIEKIAGDKYINWIYSSPVGMSLLQIIIKKRFFSKAYGYFCDSKVSRKKINSFINDFNIDTSIFEKKINEFKSFNDFFSRKLKKEARLIDSACESLISPGDGKITAYENINLDKIVHIKGGVYKLNELIDNEVISKEFSEGSCLILRLCPTDYHRYHFIDNGMCRESFRIRGNYYSVNPIALSKVSEIYCRNERQWSVFDTENFGRVLYIEIGATCVGAIIQTYKPNVFVNKGDEKGYFKFGGSTIVIMFQKDKVKIDKEIVDQTQRGFETQVFMGEKIGCKM
ncbi:phosphatidylserine decarboxylase [Clostridium diolis]|uniref:Phosphatidylserine decarboxylase proenzyme n=1 Tax=Clostridium diolis TaxID=223919 RepID=A0AAV3W5R2_9CLOT|nr:phosphatidylserine decarboxylase [Clostridium diolis]QES73443.1 phosphatidylserine decarboxylase [Clostridium diolis]GEA32832.1 phosphatidylserine decarboxylase proenzyme [Clostridium diolis]